MISFDSDIANYMESTSDGLDGYDSWLTDLPDDEDDVYHATWEEAEQAARETVERFKQYAAADRCPDCGCRAQDHNAVNRVPAGLIAHCKDCGACWKSVETAFVDVVRQSIAAETEELEEADIRW